MREIKKQLDEAVLEGRSLAAFNVPGFDAMIGIGVAAAEAHQPVIIQVSARIIRKHGAPTVRAWFDAASRITGSECFLHLDHCQDDQILRACIEAGWDMVMFDGSDLPIDLNCQRTRDIVAFAHAQGTAVEGEVGTVGGEEDGHEFGTNYARAEDIVRLGTQTGIDCIAVGFGNVHGEYSTKSNLRWEIFEGARSLCNLPLVLHGGSGLTDAEFRRAIKAGAGKINISTELKKAYGRVVSDPALAKLVTKDSSILHDRLVQAAHHLASHHIRLFSAGYQGLTV